MVVQPNQRLIRLALLVGIVFLIQSPLMVEGLVLNRIPLVELMGTPLVLARVAVAV